MGKSDKPSARLPRNVFYTGLVSLFMDVSSEMCYPIVPLFLTNVLGASKTIVGVIEGLVESTASIFKVFSGYLSDRLNRRRPLMVLGYGVSVLSRPILALSGSWSEVLASRFVDRVGKGVRSAPRDAIIAESMDAAQLGRAFGFHRAMDTIGAIAGPVIAIALLLAFSDGTGFRVVFWASIIPGVVAVFIIILFVRETGLKRPEGARSPLPRMSAFGPGFKRYVVATGVFSLGNFADAFLVLRAKSLGASDAMVPVYYLVYTVVFALLSAPLGALADKVGLRAMVIAGFAFCAMVYSGFALAWSTAHILPLFILYGVYKGMSEGTQRAYLADVSPAEHRATAFGIYHFTSGIMLLPASIMAGYLWDGFGPWAAFSWGVALSLLAAMALVLPARRSWR